MPYPNAGTLASIFAVVRKEVEDNPKYKKSDVNNNWLIYKTNAALDEIYQDCFPEPDKMTFTSDVGTWQYPFDGTTDPPAIYGDSIDEIARVDYDNKPLDRLIAERDIVLPTADSLDAAPGYWFEIWDNGVRNICFNAPCSEAKTVRLWTYRTATVLTAVTGVPSLTKDFWTLIEKILIVSIYEKIGDRDSADYYRSRYVEPRKRTLRRKSKIKFGKQARVIGRVGAQDLISNS